MVRVAEAEVALVADTTAIRVDGEERVEQEFEKAFSSGPTDGRASATGTIGGSNEGKHVTTAPSGSGYEYTPVCGRA